MYNLPAFKGNNIILTVYHTGKQCSRCLSLSKFRAKKDDMTKRKKMSWKQVSELNEFKKGTDILLGPPLTKRNKEVDYHDIDSHLDDLQDGEYFNKVNVGQFKPLSPTSNINKGKSYPMLQIEMRYSMNNQSSNKNYARQKDSQTPSKHLQKSSCSDMGKNETQNLNKKIDSSMNTSGNEKSVSADSQIPPRNPDETKKTHSNKLHMSDEKEVSSKPEIDHSLKSLLTYPLLMKDHQSAYDSSFSTYLHPHVAGLKREPSVGSILRDTMSEESKAALERWEQKKIEELGDSGFQEYKKALFRNGGNFHECVEAQLLNRPTIPLLPGNEPTWQSIQAVFKDIEDVQLVEQRVTHKTLGYMGILDSVARYRGDLVLIDWKTSDRRKNTLEAAYDDPVQIAAYMGAVNESPDFNLKLTQGLLVVAYRDGRPADVHSIPKVLCHMYWKRWLSRLHDYWEPRLIIEPSVNASSSYTKISN